MIETTNNIIFYLGYISGVLLLLLIIIILAMSIYATILKIPGLGWRLYNIQIEKSLKKASRQNLDSWIERIKEKYDEVNNNE